jgi:hypothetical protein
MKTQFQHLLIALVLLTGANWVASQVGTAFTYQGRLNDNGGPANGAYNLTFTLFNNRIGGGPFSVPVTNNGVIVSNGLFTVAVDFGPGVLLSQVIWLQIGVETNGANSFTILTPRQQLTPAPYAVVASISSSLVGTLSAAQLTSIGNTNGPSTLANFFVGPSGNAATTGPDNTANGYQALAAATSGSGNTANGAFALAHDTNGSDNTANGTFALYYNTAGFDNTADGALALYYNTNGTANTALGFEALLNNISGNGNTAVGYEALVNQGTGSSNVALGYLAGQNLSSGSFNIDIGNTGGGSDNNTIRIGTPGIHTSTYLAGDVFLPGNAFLSGNTWLDNNNVYFRTAGDTNHGLGFFGAGSPNGLFGGTNVNGPVLWGNGGGGLGTFNGSQNLALYWTTAGVTVYGTFNNNSDRNAKERFSSIRPADVLEKVARLPISEWSYKVDGATRHIGPMAQDFYSSFKVGTDEKHIAPIDEGGVALAAIQALNQKLTEKDEEIETLKAKAAKVESLELRLAGLEELVQSLAKDK